jgi:toxin ParE1/3/4
MDEIYWTDAALEDLNDIGTYIAADSPRSAEGVVRRIVETVAALAYQPRMGRIGRDESTREILVRGTPLHRCLSAARTDRDRHDLSRRAQMAGILRLS